MYTLIRELMLDKIYKSFYFNQVSIVTDHIPIPDNIVRLVVMNNLCQILLLTRTTKLKEKE